MQSHGLVHDSFLSAHLLIFFYLLVRVRAHVEDSPCVYVATCLQFSQYEYHAATRHHAGRSFQCIFVHLLWGEEGPSDV